MIDMIRRSWPVMLFVFGALATCLSVYLEIEVRAQVGRGLHRFLAHLLYDDDIQRYRRMSMWTALVGPLLCLLSYCIWRARRVANSDKSEEG